MVYIFDLDGTLVDTIGDITFSFNYALRKNKIPEIDVETARLHVGHGMDDFITNTLLPARYSDEMKAKIKADYAEYYAQHSTDFTVVYPGMSELVARLSAQGHKVVIATNKADELVGRIVKKYFDGMFDLVIGQKPGVPPKPSVELGQFVLEKMGALACECVMIGDSKYDVLFAINCGFEIIAVDWGYAQPGELAGAGALRIVSSAEEI